VRVDSMAVERMGVVGMRAAACEEHVRRLSWPTVWL
jgi:hypothetical protein